MTGNQAHVSCNACVILLAHGSGAALEEKVQGLLGLANGVIAVTDCGGEADALLEVPGVEVFTQAWSRRKGTAIAAGFERAAELGFTHAITMEADSGYGRAELGELLAAIESDPEALAIGVRDLSGWGRLRRTHARFWAWVHTGRWVRDPQSSLRAYPLEAVRKLWLRTSGHEFEREVLIRFLWCGGHVVNVPVGAPSRSGRPADRRSLLDTLCLVHLNGCLLSQRLFMPANLRSAYSQTYFRHGPRLKLTWDAIREAVRRETTSARRLALCVGVGVFFGILPIWGLQGAAAVVAAHKLRLNKPLVLAGTCVSFPGAIPFIVFASILIGRFALTGQVDCSLSPAGLDRATMGSHALDYLVGSVILATVAGLAASGFVYAIARTVMRPWRRGPQ